MVISGNIKCKFFRIIFVAPGGAGFSDERSEEMTNREGVAAGSATPKKQNTFHIKTRC